MRRLRAATMVAGLSMILAVLVAQPAAASGVVVVTHDGQAGWHSRITDGTGIPAATGASVTFVTGPKTPPLGKGSLRLVVPAGKGDGSAQFRNNRYAGVQLGALTDLRYWAYSVQNNGQQFPFLALNVNNTGGTTTDDILFFEPPYQQPATGNPACTDQGATAMNTWQQWDARHGCWWDNNGELGGGGLLGVKPLAVYIGLHPAAAIVNAGGVGGLRLAIGFGSAGDQFDGNVDAVTVGVPRGTTTYDFEPRNACQESDGNGEFQGQQQGDFSSNDGCHDGGGG